MKASRAVPVGVATVLVKKIGHSLDDDDDLMISPIESTDEMEAEMVRDVFQDQYDVE
jgi:hypothetical protein